MQKLLNSKLSRLIIYGLLLILLLPLILLCPYVHPAADDFLLCVVARDTSSLNLVLGMFNAWSPRFTAAFLFSVNPLVFGSFEGYKYVSILLISGLFIALKFLFRYLIGDQKGGSFSGTFPALLMLVCYLLNLPALSGGLYNLAESLSYQPGNIFLTAFCALLLAIPPPEGFKGLSIRDWMAMLFQCGLIILLAGCNEIAMVLTLVITFSGLIWHYFLEKKLFAGWIPLCLAAITGALLILKSPATFHRMNASGSFDRSYPEVALNAFMGMTTVLLNWMKSSSLILFLLFLFIYIASSYPKPLRITVKISWVLTIAGILVFYGTFLPSFLGEGTLQKHTENMLLFLFLLLAVFIIRIWAGQTDFRFPERIQVLLFAGFILSLPFSPAFRLAVSDLLSGEAAAFSAERDARHQLMLETPGDTVRVPSLKHKPKSLFAGDIGDYKEPWYDNYFAAMYHKKWVELKKE